MRISPARPSCRRPLPVTDSSELSATILLRPFNFNTLAVRAYELASDERLADSAPFALAIVLAGIGPVILLSRAIGRARPGYDAVP